MSKLLRRVRKGQEMRGMTLKEHIREKMKDTKFKNAWHYLDAEFELYEKVLALPSRIREEIFAVIARKDFEKDSYTHDEIFDDLKEPFAIKEAAEYLEVAEITVRRRVKEGKLKSLRIGRSIVFNPADLRAFKCKQR